MAEKRGLTAKQKLFCEHYVECRNGTEAATRAGYGTTRESAAVIASKMLKKSEILAYINELDRQLYEAIGISPELIAVRMEKLYQNSILSKRDNMALKALKEMRAIITGGQKGKSTRLNVTLHVVGPQEVDDGSKP